MSEKRLSKVGIVGIGGIAKKAYLPVLGALPGIDLIPCSRNPETVKEVMDMYNLRTGLTDLKELIKEKPDMIFLCSATEAHFEQAKLIIEARIPLHIDKPVTLSYAETKALVDLAKQYKTRVMVGFNRRYIPFVKEIAKQGSPDLIFFQKNRIIPQGDEIRHFIFDDYIHVIDTCLYLLQEPLVSIEARGTFKQGQLTMAVVHYFGKHAHAIGITNYDNGVAEEILEVMRPGEKKRVLQMESLETYQDDVMKVKTRSAWQPTLNKRGFEDMITHFISSIQNETPFDFPFEVSLKSHEVAEDIVRQLEK